MKILAIDTSGMTASVAIAEDQKTIAQFSMHHQRTHSEQLLPMVDHMLGTALWDVGDIDLFAVAKGPGSFTGLRIGIATVKALAHAAGKPIAAVSTLDALSANCDVRDSALICPILDARRSQVYTAVYQNGAKILEDTALSLQELLSFIGGRKTTFLGDGVDVHRQTIETVMGERARFVQEQFRYQNAASLIKVAIEIERKGDTIPYYQIEPSYLRVSQAERERAQKMKNEI